MHTLDRKKITIGASISCADLMNLARELRRIERAGIDFIHYDVIDGRFNDTFILGVPTLKSLRELTGLPIEVHLAVFEPGLYIDQFIEAGADYVAVHYEAAEDISPVLRRIKELGARPVLALRVETDVDEQLCSLLGDVDWVLKLSVDPGYAGQSFRANALDMIEKLRKEIDLRGLDTGLLADGNINPQTAGEVVRRGADMLVGGSSGLFLPDLDLRTARDRLLRAAGRV